MDKTFDGTMDREKFSKNLPYFLKNRDMKVAELARETPGFTARQIRAAIKDPKKVTLGMAEAVAKALGIRLDYLI